MRRWLLGVLVAVLLAVGWWFFFISPRNSDITEANDQLDAAQAQEQRLRVQIAQLQELQADELLYLDAITTLEGLIPDRPLLDEFIEAIDALAANTGVELKSLAPSVPVPTIDSELRLINISTQLEGEFFDVLGFLFGLNDMERLVRVDAVALTSSVDSEGVTTLSVTLEIRLFTLADLIPIPALDEGVPGLPEESESPPDESGGEGSDLEASSGALPLPIGPGGG